MTNLFLTLAILFSATASIASNKSCNLTILGQSSPVVSHQTNNFAASNYTAAVNELKAQCPNGDLTEPVWHATSSVSFPIYHEYGVWKANCINRLSSTQIKEEVCSKIAVCIVEALPNENIDWLVAKSKALNCQ